MIFIKLDSLDTVQKLCKISDKYKDAIMDIDVVYGRQTIDARSILGITSLMGNIVKIVPISSNIEAINTYFDEIKEIGAYEV